MSGKALGSALVWSSLLADMQKLPKNQTTVSRPHTQLRRRNLRSQAVPACVKRQGKTTIPSSSNDDTSIVYKIQSCKQQGGQTMFENPEKMAKRNMQTAVRQLMLLTQKKQDDYKRLQQIRQKIKDLKVNDESKQTFAYKIKKTRQMQKIQQELEQLRIPVVRAYIENLKGLLAQIGDNPKNQQLKILKQNIQSNLQIMPRYSRQNNKFKFDTLGDYMKGHSATYGTIDSIQKKIKEASKSQK